jgi:hypothetical protein
MEAVRVALPGASSRLPPRASSRDQRKPDWADVPMIGWRWHVRIRILVQKWFVFLPWIARGMITFSLTSVLALLCVCRQSSERCRCECGRTGPSKLRRYGLSTSSISFFGSLIVFSPMFSNRHCSPGTAIPDQTFPECGYPRSDKQSPKRHDETDTLKCARKCVFHEKALAMTHIVKSA